MRERLARCAVTQVASLPSGGAPIPALRGFELLRWPALRRRDGEAKPA